MQLTFDIPQTSQPNSISSNVNIDSCTTLAWIDLVATDWDESEGDDWLNLCGDISEGEIYRDWFLWQDVEGTKAWEAYDPLDNSRHTDMDLATLKAKIDRIENARNYEEEALTRRSA